VDGRLFVDGPPDHPYISFRSTFIRAAVYHGQARLLEVKLPGDEHLIAGKGVTGFSWDEEDQVGRDDAVPDNLEEELQKRGARYGKARMAFSSHVVEDGKPITGQNPARAAAVGEAVVKRLKEA
jgi:putative intracellular protease/amidase